MTKTYAETCLERAESPQGLCLQYLHDVPELARRLKRACETIDEATHYIDNCLYDIEYFQRIVKELEVPPEDKK